MFTSSGRLHTPLEELAACNAPWWTWLSGIALGGAGEGLLSRLPRGGGHHCARAPCCGAPSSLATVLVAVPPLPPPPPFRWCAVLGFSTERLHDAVQAVPVALALSEDHAFLALGDGGGGAASVATKVDRCFAEIAYPSPADSSKRGGPLPTAAGSSTWLYMHGGQYAFVADSPAQMIAAMVANIQPTPKGARAKDGEEDDESLAVLKRELLWTLKGDRPKTVLSIWGVHL